MKTDGRCTNNLYLDNLDNSCARREFKYYREIFTPALLALLGLEEVLPRLSGHFDMIFFDQRGSRFLKDVEILLHEAALTTHGTVLVADNVLKPGAPRFLWYLQGENEDEDGEWETCFLAKFGL